MVDFEQLQTDLLALEQVNGIVPVDILSLPHELGSVIRGLVRDKTITSVELADAAGISESQARTAAAILIEKGYLLKVENDDKKTEDIDNIDDKVNTVTADAGDQPLHAQALQDQDDTDTDTEVMNEEIADEVHEYRIRFARMRKQRISIDL